MGCVCQWSAVVAVTMSVVVVAAALATLTSLITAHQPTTPGKNCFRKCVSGDTRVCHFRFHVHPYQTLSRACYGCPANTTDCAREECVAGDGNERRILVVNKQMPGPPIQVCQGDTVIVDVHNSLYGSSLTIHWHGVTLEGPPGSPHLGAPHMDGVPWITQCPIPPGASFRYTFPALNPGTHFYHAHTAFHRGDGVYGALIVRQPPQQDPNYGAFDHDLPEHTILIHDWLHMPTEDKFTYRHHSGGDDFPESMLVNGLGPHQHAFPTSLPALTPYKRFMVDPGKRYLLRVISNAILNCPITFSVEGHPLTVIASDGNPIVHINVSSLVVYPGERWDVVLSTCPDKRGSFWMSFMGGVDCAESAAHQFALLLYRRVESWTKGLIPVQEELEDTELLKRMSPKPRFTRELPRGRQVNTINSACYEDRVCVADLRSPYPLPEDLAVPKPNFTFYLAFEMRRMHNAHFYSRLLYDFYDMLEEQQIPTPQINNLTFSYPSAPLLVEGVREDNYLCSAEEPPDKRSCHDEYCACLHLYHVPLGATVDMVLIDEGQYGDENHPIHLHGHHFYVIGQDRPNDQPDAALTRAQVIEMDERGKLKRNLERPVLKDTVTIPDAGYTIIRFKATNPGYWLLHCHLLFHSVAGMDLILKVGEDAEMAPPPQDFPTCRSFKGTNL